MNSYRCLRFVVFMGSMALLAFTGLTKVHARGNDTNNELQGKRIALILPFRDFADREYTIPKNQFEKAGATVITVSTKTGSALGMQKTSAKVDLTIDQIDVSQFDAIVFIGGSGVQTELWNNETAHKIARETLKKGKLLAAICWAPVILANAGVLKGVKATVATDGGAKRYLTEGGALYTGETVTRDGLIITGNGPMAAEAFAATVLTALKG